jgi:hypothetical protein
LKEELTKAKGGREFLAIWEKVYIIGGIATAGALIVTGLFFGRSNALGKAIVGSCAGFCSACVDEDF